MYFSFIPFFSSRSIKSPSSKVYQKLALIVYLPNFADSLLYHDKGHRLLSLMLLVSNLLQVISFFSSTLHHFFYACTILITNFLHKKSQIPSIRLVSSCPFRSSISANSVQNSTKYCQISRFLRLRHTRRQNILPRIHLSLSLYYKLSPVFPQSLFSMR